MTTAQAEKGDIVIDVEFGGSEIPIANTIVITSGVHTGFKVGPLKITGSLHDTDSGITSTASRVESLDRLVEYVGQRVLPGGYLLAYYDVPLVYFATGTRPAVCTSWVMDNWHGPLEGQVLADMLARSRIPELVIRNRIFPGRQWPAYETGHKKNYTYDTYSSEDPERRPFNAWVEDNYALAERIGPFEIWSPRTAAASDNAGRAQLLASTDDPIDDQ